MMTFERSERVQKIISATGYCSRRKAEELIAKDLVKVNNKNIKLGDKADPYKDTILVEGNPLPKRNSDSKINSKKYYLLNKPKGYVTTLSDPFKQRTISNLLAMNKIYERVYPVGRLDENTEGLIILTNDGDFANRIMHPRYEVKKTYEAEIDKPIENKDLQLIRTGIIIEGKKTWPAEAGFVSGNKRLLRITIHEGRNRIIRRMLKKLKYHVRTLRRINIGGIQAGNLKQGQIRKLSNEEIKRLIQEKPKKQIQTQRPQYSPRKTFK